LEYFDSILAVIWAFLWNFRGVWGWYNTEVWCSFGGFRLFFVFLVCVFCVLWGIVGFLVFLVWFVGSWCNFVLFWVFLGILRCLGWYNIVLAFRVYNRFLWRFGVFVALCDFGVILLVLVCVLGFVCIWGFSGVLLFGLG